MSLICLDDFEEVASKKLPKSYYEYYRSGAFEESTLRRNRTAFERIRIIPRVLRNTNPLDLSCKIFGSDFQLPIGISPTAFQKLAHPDGEIGNARAAGEFSIPFTLSIGANTSIEELATSVPNTTKWFQMYIMRDPELTKRIVKRVENCGFKAIVLTVDRPVLGNRRSDRRHNFSFPEHLPIANFLEEIKSISVKSGEKSHVAIVENLVKEGVTWEDVKWLKSITKLPVILKGILSPDDALISVQCGVAGIIVSNHGGRQMDSTQAAIEALPKIVDVVKDRLVVILDSGVRQGTDIFKALALGAKLVMIGRPAIWGLTVNGQKGVEEVLNILQKELKIAMAMAGCRTLDDIKPCMVTHDFQSNKF